MTSDERILLTSFLTDLNATQGVQKDSEADGMIRQALTSNPDAAYVLVQHAIVSDQSLHAAQARIAELEGQLGSSQVPATSTNFLPAPAQPARWHTNTQQSYTPLPQDYAPMPPQERPGVFSPNSGLGSFLRNAGTTAAGVAGGEMLFNGLSNLFGRRDYY